jgi:hypothetical protein
MAEARHETEGEQQINREQKKIVDDTEKAGGTVHEFDPDATPQQKAAALRKVISLHSMPIVFLLTSVV